jgi:hypothetical protein
MSEEVRSEAGRLQLSAVHLIRTGVGLDGVRVRATGRGLLLGPFGFRWVRRAADFVSWRRFRADRCRVFFLGLHGLRTASVTLPPAGQARVPAVSSLQVELPRPAPAIPTIELDLTLTPPELP